MAVAGLVAAGRAAEAESAPGPVSAKLLGSGTVLEDGGAEVRVLVRCEPEPPLLEALVTGSQEGAVGHAEGFFSGLVCDGRPHVTTARLITFDEERFERGKARFSAFVLLCDDVSGECFTGQDTRLVQLR
jgi:hypothetical protein